MPAPVGPRPGVACNANIGKSGDKRARAACVSEHWRTDNGRLCFDTTLERVSEMLDSGLMALSFPALVYKGGYAPNPTASAHVPEIRVPAYRIGPFCNRRCNNDVLKDILTEHDVTTTGNKEALVEKYAKLAARQYAARAPELDAFFSENRFIRVHGSPLEAQQFPLLEDAPLLRNLLLTMYAMKHLRGNAILDSSHENPAYTGEQLALALLTCKVDLSGVFLHVA